MSKRKSWLSALLCAALAVALAFGLVPETAEASNPEPTLETYVYWDNLGTPHYDPTTQSSYYNEWDDATSTSSKVPVSNKPWNIRVEKGQSFYIGDYATYYYYYDADIDYDDGWNDKEISQSLSEISKTRYKSSKKKIASVEKKTGLVTAKKTGTTVITVKSKGQVLQCNLTVMPKKSLGSTQKVMKKYIKAINKCSKTFPKKVTAKNSYAAYNSYATLRNKVETFNKKLFNTNQQLYGSSWNGILDPDDKYELKYYSSDDYPEKNDDLVVPNMGRIDYMSNVLYNYRTKASGIALYTNKSGANSVKGNLQIKKISAKQTKKTVTVKLNKKVSAANIFGIKAYNAFMNYFYSYTSYPYTYVHTRLNYNGELETSTGSSTTIWHAKKLKKIKKGTDVAVTVYVKDANGQVSSAKLTLTQGSKTAKLKFGSKLPAGTYTLYGSLPKYLEWNNTTEAYEWKVYPDSVSGDWINKYAYQVVQKTDEGGYTYTDIEHPGIAFTAK